jgi:hypothetical protein
MEEAPRMWVPKMPMAKAGILQVLCKLGAKGGMED